MSRKISEQALLVVLIAVVVVLMIGIAITGVYIFTQIKESRAGEIAPTMVVASQEVTLEATVAKQSDHTTSKPPTRTPKPARTSFPRTVVPLIIDTPVSDIPVETPDPFADLPEGWLEDAPTLPHVSDTAREIYRRGIEQGNDPTHFSKVGDCQSIRQYFLSIFDDPVAYRIGPYDYLNEVIDQFPGSFDRKSLAVKTGWNVASVLTPLNADPQQCEQSESPLECEFRVWNPSIVLISMETWTLERPTSLYESYLRQIVEFAIQNNVLPILATKADNLEGNQAINAAIVRVAKEYDVPLWNFWGAVQSLPEQGLMEDRFHLTNEHNRFDDEEMLKYGWQVRNLTALMALDVVWREVNDLEASKAEW
jgi:hypothetical protein